MFLIEKKIPAKFIKSLRNIGKDTSEIYVSPAKLLESR